MAVLRLFAAARLAAGTGRTTVPGATVGDVLEGACARFGDDLRAVLPSCRIWLNGEVTDRAASAAPIFPSISLIETTSRLPIWPQVIGDFWSSMKMAATPSSS